MLGSVSESALRWVKSASLVVAAVAAEEGDVKDGYDLTKVDIADGQSEGMVQQVTVVAAARYLPLCGLELVAEPVPGRSKGYLKDVQSLSTVHPSSAVQAPACHNTES